MNRAGDIVKRLGEVRAGWRGWELFRDWVAAMSLAFRSSVSTGAAKNDLESEYATLVDRYGHEVMKAFADALGMLTMIMEEDPRDALGEIFMLSGWGEGSWGQFFTPREVSGLVAALSMQEDAAKEVIARKGFVTLYEPAAGAGGMLIEASKLMRSWGLNPQKQLLVTAWELDRDAALMLYVQLALLHIPARVVVGNTLTLEVFDVFYTPAFILGLWRYRVGRDYHEDIPVEAVPLVEEAEEGDSDLSMQPSLW